MTDLQELFACAASNAADIFKQRGEVVPMWHMVKGNGEHVIVVTPWSDRDEKHLIVAIMRATFRKQRVQRYVFMSEAWTMTVQNVKDVEHYIGRFHEHPDRREVLMIQAEDKDGSSMGGMFYILRPEHSRPTLSPLQMCDAPDQEGQLQGLLK